MFVPFFSNKLFTENEFYTSSKVEELISQYQRKNAGESNEDKVFIYTQSFYKSEDENGEKQKLIQVNGIGTIEENENNKAQFSLFCLDKELIRLSVYLIKKKDYIEESDEETSLRLKIKEFVERENAYNDFDAKVRERILGQKNISEITYNIFVWLRSLAHGDSSKFNAMIAAPSGCGKTETFRVIKEILCDEIADIPVIQTDVTQLTAEGFSGKNVNAFFTDLLNYSINGIGIVVLDEIDKRLLPSYTSHGTNANNEIQSQLLTFIEGIEYTDQDCNRTIDTSNTLFIASGSFQSIRDKKNKKKDTCVTGFHELIVEKDDTNSNQDDITIEEIIENGALCELVGRFSTIINYHKLDRHSVGIVCRRYADEIERQINCKICMTEEAIDQLYNTYDSSNLGCRILRSEMWNNLSPICIQLEKTRMVSKDNITICYGAEKVYYYTTKTRKEKRCDIVS